MTADADALANYVSGIRIAEVRVRNFRSLRQIDVALSDLTLLVGENNAGKTSFLDAMFAAIGAGRRVITRDDIYLAPGEQAAPRDRTIVVDILIRPVDADGCFLDAFPEGSYWVQLWGNAIAQDVKDDSEFLALRATLEWDATRNEHVLRRRFLQDWPESDRWAEAKVRGDAVAANQVEPLALHFLDAQRDLYDEFTNRGSYWHRLISDPGLPSDLVTKLELELTALNQQIIDGSPVLDHIGKHLVDLYRTVSCERESITITPLPRHLRDLSRGMDVQFATQGAASLPLGRHGMGTRSLAAILIFRAYCAWRLQSDGLEVMHPMLALEEPEAHLHPQAQRAVMRQIEKMPGQRVVSTHSPFIVAQTDVDAFRVFRKRGAETEVASTIGAGWSAEDREKINRKVMATRGELIFARAVVFFEGETEEFSLPVFAEAYWGEHPSTFGVTMVGVGGDGAYAPFLRFAQCFGIPWFILSDGEEKARANVNRALGSVGEGAPSARVFTLPDEENFETYLAKQYPSELKDVVLARRAQSPQHREGLEKEWAAKPEISPAVAEEMKQEKAIFGRLAAEAITRLPEVERRVPSVIADMLTAIAHEIGLPKAGT
ncbi:MAG: ATP-dependent nuclease [Hyphomicrobiales bacterium]